MIAAVEFTPDEHLVQNIIDAIRGNPYDDVISSLLAVAIDVSVEKKSGKLENARGFLHETLDQLLDRYRDEVINRYTGDDEE